MKRGESSEGESSVEIHESARPRSFPTFSSPAAAFRKTKAGLAAEPNGMDMLAVACGSNRAERRLGLASAGAMGRHEHLTWLSLGQGVSGERGPRGESWARRTQFNGSSSTAGRRECLEAPGATPKGQKERAGTLIETWWHTGKVTLNLSTFPMLGGGGWGRRPGSDGETAASKLQKISDSAYAP